MQPLETVCGGSGGGQKLQRSNNQIQMFYYQTGKKTAKYNDTRAAPNTKQKMKGVSTIPWGENLAKLCKECNRLMRADNHKQIVKSIWKFMSSGDWCKRGIVVVVVLANFGSTNTTMIIYIPFNSDFWPWPNFGIFYGFLDPKGLFWDWGNV